MCRLLLGGTLDKVLKRRKQLPESCLRTVAQRVLLGLVNMQTHARLHHIDLKPANLGLLRAGNFESTVLLDFGSALPLGAVRSTCFHSRAWVALPMGSGWHLIIRGWSEGSVKTC